MPNGIPSVPKKQPDRRRENSCVDGFEVSTIEPAIAAGTRTCKGGTGVVPLLTAVSHQFTPRSSTLRIVGLLPLKLDSLVYNTYGRTDGIENG